MTEIDNIQENIDIDVTPVTLDLPIRITMISTQVAPFDFTVSVDELGHIVLTPVDASVEFSNAMLVDNNVDSGTPNQELDNSTYTTVVQLHANMLQEADNSDVEIAIDDIGQCVIAPAALENTFVTVSVEDSLNLVTEEPESEDYFGYRLSKVNEGWTVVDYTGAVIAENITTQSAAKIAACANEIKLLEAISEEESQVPKVTAEVVEDEVAELLEELTQNYTDNDGCISCDTLPESAVCVKLLSEKYITEELIKENKYLVKYCVPFKE